MAVILFEDFEDSTITYTTNFADDLTDIASRDYYGRIDAGSGLPVDVVYTNQQGTGFYGVQDTNSATIPASSITLDWTGIDISGMYNLDLSAFFAEDTAGDGNEDWDISTSVRIEIQIDGGGFQDFFAIESASAVTGNEAPFVDTNFDGVGDGAAITDVFTQYSGAVGLGSTLDIRITIEDLDTGDEDIAFDNVLLTGDSTTNVVVDTLIDEDDGDYSAGDLSLREALTLVAAGGTISFDASITGGMTAGVDDGVITLGGTELAITQDVTIDGDTDGDDKADITLSGDNTSRVFNITGAGTDASLLSLDIADGDSASSKGGAIYSSGASLTIVDSTVRDSGAGSGGGVHADTLTMVNATVSGNTANYGGGLYLNSGGTFDNVTITGNTATSDGGAIDSSGTVTFRNSTISDNTATDDFGGIRMFGGFATVLNTIVSGNTQTTAGQDIGTEAGSTLTAQNSLLGTAVVIATDNGGNISSDTPMLDALADNGGTVDTHGLQFGSLAIANGDAALLAFDAQDIDDDMDVAEALPLDADGNNRAVGALDIGAVEFNSTLVVDTLNDEDDGDYSAGDLSLREALSLVAADGTISFDSTVFAADDDELINATIGLNSGHARHHAGRHHQRRHQWRRDCRCHRERCWERW